MEDPYGFNVWINARPPVKRAKAKLLAAKFEHPFTITRLAELVPCSIRHAQRAMNDNTGYIVTHLPNHRGQGWLYFPRGWKPHECFEWLDSKCKSGRSRARIYENGTEVTREDAEALKNAKFACPDCEIYENAENTAFEALYSHFLKTCETKPKCEEAANRYGHKIPHSCTDCGFNSRWWWEENVT